MHVVAHRLLGGNNLRVQCTGWFGCLIDGRVFGPSSWQIRQVGPGLLNCILVIFGKIVSAARHGGVHASATCLFERRDLSDHHFGHTRRPQIHRRVALDHDHDVGKRWDVGAAGG